MVSEVSVHGHLAQLLWVCDSTVSWQEHTEEETAHLMVPGKQNEREEVARVPVSPLKVHPHDLTSSHLLKAPPPISATFWGPNL
jgi:hypothetical protein